jgi:DNA replication and repair protein RecF
MPHLAALRAENFRCFEHLVCPLGPGLTAFVGDNAQGKTSVLEAVCLLLRLQSPRTTTLADLARFGQPHGFGLAGECHTTDSVDSQASTLKLRWNDGRRSLTANGETNLGSSRYLARSAILVWMGNDDLALVRAGSDGRRRYLDFLGSQAFPSYHSTLLAYDKALRSRNRLLKDDRPDPRQIAAYTTPLLEHGTTLTRLRAELVEALVPWAAASHDDISEGAAESLEPAYHSGATADFPAALAASAPEEVRRRLTVVGPHRDDLPSPSTDAPPPPSPPKDSNGPSPLPSNSPRPASSKPCTDNRPSCCSTTFSVSSTPTAASPCSTPCPPMRKNSSPPPALTGRPATSVRTASTASSAAP